MPAYRLVRSKTRRCVLVCQVGMAWVAAAGGCTRDETSGSPSPVVAGGARRIIALAPNAAEIICGLGACDALVGVSSFCEYPPQLADVPKIGGLRDPDLETIVSLAPDLFVFRGRSEPLERLCKAHNIRIHNDPTESLEDMFRTMNDLGRLLDRRVEASRMISQVRSELDRVAAVVADRPRVSVLFILWHGADSLTNVMAAGRDTFLHELIEVAGGRNVFGTMDVRYPTVSLESIVAAAPEVIIDATEGLAMTADQKSALLDQWRRIGPIPAVERGRVHFVSDSYFTIPSQRVTLIAWKLVSLLHPEVSAGG